MTKRMSTAAALLLILILGAVCVASADEYRDMYINAWSSGFENANATGASCNFIRSLNCNTVVPEVRLRCDAYYNSSIEPPGTGVAPAGGYDSLADMVVQTHARSMKVHPWVIAYRIWTTDGGPGHMSPEHIWWTHGPGNTNPSQDWCMRSQTGGWSYGGESDLDPGHPAVEDYLITVFMDIVSNYNIDGLLLDHIRYPATDWGYNAVSVQRFNLEYGRTGSPGSGDSTWQNWRRDQVSNLVKRLYLEIKAVKPHVKLGASVWNTAGSGNSTYFQNWDQWMQKHWIDYVSPMTYTSDNSTFTSWMNDAIAREYGHHIYPLIDASNSISGNVLPQIDIVRQKGFPGLGLYVYSTVDKANLPGALTTGNGPFPTFVNPTGMPWLDTPTLGYLKGFVKDSNGNALYPSTVTISSQSTKNTGTGFYGFVDLTPGSYTVHASAVGYLSVDLPVTITAGTVANLNFTLPTDTTAPVITNVGTANVQATNAQITWTTDILSTSQVDYGTTSSYGTTTTENMLLTTSHTVQLINLTPSTLYHFRVRSYSGGRVMSQLGDFTFTTRDSDVPLPIIVDNSDSGCSTSGSWVTGTSASDKYGANYFYCSGASQGKTCTWRPNVISANNYNVYACWPAGGNRTTHAPFSVHWNGGSQSMNCNQQANGGQFNLLVANVPFAVGTGGYIQLTNNGVEGTLNVMADAIKIEYADTQAPTPPSDLTAAATSAGQISLNWTASTDNVGVTGYYVSRNSAQVGAPTTNSYTDTGLAANTQYSYFVRAHDGAAPANNVSAPSPTVARFSLSTPPGSASVTCDKPTNTWQTSPTFTFTATGGFGAGKIQYYKYAFDESSTHSWTGFEQQWSSGTLPVQASAGGTWYLHVKGCNGDGVENGNYDYGPYKYDGTAVQVTDLEDGKYVDATGQLHASWSGSDPETGVSEYKYAIVTSPGDIGSATWTSVGTSTSVTTTGLTLSANTTYYFGVKALNGAGTWSDPVVSDGVTAATAVDTISDAKKLGNNQAIIMTGKVVSADFGTFCYVCENEQDQRISAIRVEGASTIEGDLADVSGVIQCACGERVITNPDLSPSEGPGAPKPIMVGNRSVGGGALNESDYTPGVTDGAGTNNIGVLVTVIGKVIDSGVGYFTVDDGWTVLKVSTLKVTDVPDAGKFVRATGIVSTELSGGVVTPMIIPRANSDVPHPWY